MKELYTIPFIGRQNQTTTLSGLKRGDALKQLQSAIVGSDAGSACFLSCDLLASGALDKTVGVFIELSARLGFEIIQSHGLHEQMVRLLNPAHDDMNDIHVRHLLVDTVVRLALLFRRGEMNSEINAYLAIPLQALKNEFLPALQAAPVSLDPALYRLYFNSNSPITPMSIKIIQLCHQFGPGHSCVRFVLFLLKQSKDKSDVKEKIETLLWCIAMKFQFKRAKTLLALYQQRPKPCILASCFANIEPSFFTVGENKNLVLALLKTNLIFEDLKKQIPGDQIQLNLGMNADTRHHHHEPKADLTLQRSINDIFQKRAKLNAIRHY